MRDQLFTDRVVLAERTIATKSVAKQLFRSAKAIVAKVSTCFPSSALPVSCGGSVDMYILLAYVF